MNEKFVLLSMIFLHGFDDFCLQRIARLGDLKQKKWWEENAPKELYKYDYIVALIVHGLQWAFMVMLPIAYISNFDISWMFIFLWLWHGLLHAQIDHLKANLGKFNLIADQLLHLMQIFSIWAIMISEFYENGGANALF